MLNLTNIWRHFHWRPFVAMTCNLVKVEMKFHFECKLLFPSARLLLLQIHLTLSLLRVINVKIPLQPHKKYDITQYGELDFS